MKEIGYTPFLGIHQELPNDARKQVYVYGLPDSTHSISKSNAWLGPEMIRILSNSISDDGVPVDGLLNRKNECALCSGLNFVDKGNLFFPKNEIEFKHLKTIIRKSEGQRRIYLLGDDACNFPLFVGEKGVILHFDAHDDAENTKQYLNHGNFLKYLVDNSPELLIIQVGLREMINPKYISTYSNNIIHPGTIGDFESIISSLPNNVNCSICIDCDVFDSTYISRVTCPQPFGMSVREFLEYIKVLVKYNTTVSNISLSEFSPTDKMDQRSALEALSLAELLIMLSDIVFKTAL